MANKIWLPPLDSRWRFLADWDAPQTFYDLTDNEKTLWASDWSQDWDKYSKIEPYDRENGWVDRYRKWREAARDERGKSQFLKGTVIQIERYHVSRSGQDLITLKVLAAPDTRLMPRKLGGTMAGPGRIYVDLAQFNTFPELEPFEED